MNEENFQIVTDQKESNELATFQGRFINGVYKDAEDGELNPIGDFAEYIPAVLSAQPAFAGLGNYGNEQAAATVADKENRLNILKTEMSAVPETDAYDVAHGIHGLECFYAMAKRNGRKEGVEAERKRIEAKLKANGIDISVID